MSSVTAGGVALKLIERHTPLRNKCYIEGPVGQLLDSRSVVGKSALGPGSEKDAANDEGDGHGHHGQKRPHHLD